MANASIRKYTIFVVMVAGLVWLDQATKIWADHNLASETHPLPLLVTEEMSGRTVGELLIERFPDLADDIDATVARHVTRGRREVQLDPDRNPFAPLEIDERHRFPLAYLMFLDGLERAPRTVNLLGKPFARRWLSFLVEDQSRIEKLLDDSFADERLAEYLAAHHVRVDEGDVRTLIERGHVMPLMGFNDNVTANERVARGALYLLHERKVDVIPGFFRLEYKENPGAAWGLFAGAHPTFRRLFLTSISTLASIVILVVFFRLPPTHLSAIIAFSAILGGAVGNLIDRFQYNYVIDFLDMYIGRSHWPTYNVADIGITLGVLALVVEMLFVKSSPFAQIEGEKPTTTRRKASPSQKKDAKAEG